MYLSNVPCCSTDFISPKKPVQMWHLLNFNISENKTKNTNSFPWMNFNEFSESWQNPKNGMVTRCFTYLSTNTIQELVVIGSIFLLISSLECVSLFQMQTNIKRSNFKVCISQMFHAAPLILFRPKNQCRCDTCWILTFQFLDHIKFGNVALNVCKDNLKCSVNFIHLNLHFK